MADVRDGYSPANSASRLQNLKNTQFYSEKNSTFRKFETFVSGSGFPGERVFVFVLTLTLLCARIASAQPEAAWKVPDSLGPDRWQVNLRAGTLLLSSPHASWLYAYSLKGGLLWKRHLSWPATAPLQEASGQILLQYPGQPPTLLQPQTGESRPGVLPITAGWIVARSDGSWIHLDPQGFISTAPKELTPWRRRGQLRLGRDDQWVGPPVWRDGMLFVSSARGELRRVELDPVFKASVARPYARPLLPVLSHPAGVLLVGVDGHIALRRAERSWERPFSGWGECYSASGEILARPCQDEAGNIYLATRSRLYAWDADGRSLWTRFLPAVSAVHWARGKLYVVDNDPALIRIHPASGQIEDRRQLPAFPSGGMAIADDRLALALTDGSVQVLELPAP